MSLNGFPFRKDSGIALLGLNSSGEPWMTWASGPKGVRSYGAGKTANGEGGEVDANAPTDVKDPEPAALYSRSAVNTVDDVVGLGSGPGTERLRGSIDSTAIFEIMRDQL